ncbi:3D domain-containing protein [Sinomicrobium sp. FJxs]|uniref:3D domain-containing protein n=2 Tax=Sinomicrobium weinanense TaxID=2842200 RepID=A0A926JPS4_9FLAO|nr:3D domain-containing protein [Sinomicrobium weinanense]
MTALVTVVVLSGFTNNKAPRQSITLEVTAMAYNSVNSQTKRGDPTLTAWGDKLKPGMKSIAVSHDLIKMGLGHNTKVKIEGLAGVYVVKDKMNKRWKKKIDIYMGQDVKAARKWGRRKVTITFTP